MVCSGQPLLNYNSVSQTAQRPQRSISWQILARLYKSCAQQKPDLKRKQSAPSMEVYSERVLDERVEEEDFQDVPVSPRLIK